MKPDLPQQETAEGWLIPQWNNLISTGNWRAVQLFDTFAEVSRHREFASLTAVKVRVTVEVIGKPKRITGLGTR